MSEDFPSMRFEVATQVLRRDMLSQFVISLLPTVPANNVSQTRPKRGESEACYDCCLTGRFVNAL